MNINQLETLIALSKTMSFRKTRRNAQFNSACCFCTNQKLEEEYNSLSFRSQSAHGINR